MDGAPSMMGKNIGALGILSRKYPHIKINRCIIHHQNLASKDLSPNFFDVMQVVISTVNYVKARELNSRLFKQLCITENSSHHTLLMHTAVRWLSRGKLWKGFSFFVMNLLHFCKIRDIRMHIIFMIHFFLLALHF